MFLVINLDLLYVLWHLRYLKVSSGSSAHIPAKILMFRPLPAELYKIKYIRFATFRVKSELEFLKYFSKKKNCRKNCFFYIFSQFSKVIFLELKV